MKDCTQELVAAIKDYIAQCEKALESASDEEFIIVFIKPPLVGYRLNEDGELKACRVHEAPAFRSNDIPKPLLRLIRSGRVSAEPRKTTIKKTMELLEQYVKEATQ